MNRNWLIVFIAGLFEVVWVSGLKYANHWWAWLGTAVAIMISFTLLIYSARKLPVGTVYAVFAGLGTAGTVLVEMLIFDEPFELLKIALILLLLTGVIGLKAVTKEEVKGAEQ